MTKRGQPTKFNEAVAAKLVAGLRRGQYLESVSAAVGISTACLRSWRAKGRAGDVRFSAFEQRLEQASAEWEIEVLERIERAAQAGSLVADLWRLERRFASRWAKRRAVNDPTHRELRELAKRKQELELQLLQHRARAVAVSTVDLLPDSTEYQEWLQREWGFRRRGLTGIKGGCASPG